VKTALPGDAKCGAHGSGGIGLLPLPNDVAPAGDSRKSPATFTCVAPPARQREERPSRAHFSRQL